jgi:hypothetical protein
MKTCLYDGCKSQLMSIYQCCFDINTERPESKGSF